MDLNNLQKSTEIVSSREKKTIVIFSANYLPNIGGIEQFTHNLSDTLELSGFHTIIVTNNVFNLKQHECFDSGVEIFRLPCFPLINGRLPLPKKDKQFKQIMRRLRELTVDYILINTRFYPHTFLGIELAKFHNIIPVLIDHGSAYLTFGNRFLDKAVVLYEKAITALLKRNRIDFYGISKASQKWLDNFHISSCGVINNSIDADLYYKNASSRNFRSELYLSNETFLVVFTGRLIPEKGIINILNAARVLKSKNINAVFAIAGDGPLKKSIQENNPGNIYLLGKLSSEDISSLLIQGDAFCLPTRSEGFSTSLLEAAACYTTPIITNVGGVAELIPSEDFGIVLADNPTGEEISDAILLLIENEKQNHQMGLNIGSRVRKHFSWQQTATLVISACKKANS